MCDFEWFPKIGGAGSRVLEEGGHILNQLSVHDITGDIKMYYCISR